MRIILTALSLLLLLLGIFSLALPITLLSSALSGESSPLSLAAIIPALALAIGVSWSSASFLKRRGRKTANRMAYVAGFFVWISTKSLAVDFSQSNEEDWGKGAVLALFLLPILLGILTTKTIKFLIRKAYETEGYPPR
ncbi:hypothetical protein [Puniceicoccus vermicola]|uniref:Uncharacterized protein n=1 Tax=Puniceicoccus vermicola TaxID=388746 RepID=A0A7X1AZW2_9BACT|nr:hypothetical protein [Puniceicoccus vermicola]MBC2601993.1 hypothetical protein [Puniceicoccus vermicola]